MADLRKILNEKDPLLHQPCQEVSRFGDSLHRLLDDMKLTMYEEKGVGLAAPQVGVSKRVAVIDDREHGYYELVNPRITAASGREEDVEFCLSVPDRGGVVRRYTKITVEAQDRFGQPFTVAAEDYQARVFQHEIDHLDGRLFTDIMIKEIHPEQEEKRKVVARRKKEN